MEEKASEALRKFKDGVDEAMDRLYSKLFPLPPGWRWQISSRIEGTDFVISATPMRHDDPRVVDLTSLNK